MLEMKKLKLLITIVERGKGQKVAEFLKTRQIPIHIICLGHGTANSDLLNYLGLGEPEKDIVLSTIWAETAATTVQKLADALKLEQPGQGIAFTIPMGSVGGSKTLSFMAGKGKES